MPEDKTVNRIFFSGVGGSSDPPWCFANLSISEASKLASMPKTEACSCLVFKMPECLGNHRVVMILMA